MGSLLFEILLLAISALFAEILRLKDEKISVLEKENKFLKSHAKQLEQKLEEGKKQQAEDQKQKEETQNQLNECKEDLRNKKGFIVIKFIIKLIVTLEELIRTAENTMVIFHSNNNKENIYDESIESFRDSRVIAPDYDKELKLTFRKGDVLFDKLVAVFGRKLGGLAEALMNRGCFGFKKPLTIFTIKVGGDQEWTLYNPIDVQEYIEDYRLEEDQTGWIFTAKDDERYLTIDIENRNVSNLKKSFGKYADFNRF